MEFSLAKMRLKDAAIIMNNEARCLPFLIATPKEGRKKGEKEREKVGYSLCQSSSSMHIHRCVQGACIHGHMCVLRYFVCL